MMMMMMMIHVYYSSSYMSLPSSANKVLLTAGTTAANFAYSYLELNAFVTVQQGLVLIPTNELNRSK